VAPTDSASFHAGMMTSARLKGGRDIYTNLYQSKMLN
jgi:hypothetical protein